MLLIICVLRKNVTKIIMYENSSLFVNNIRPMSLNLSSIPSPMLVGFSFTLTIVIIVVHMKTILIIKDNIKKPDDIDPLPKLFAKKYTKVKPSVPNKRLDKLANIRGTTETSSLSTGLFVKLGNQDQ